MRTRAPFKGVPYQMKQLNSKAAWWSIFVVIMMTAIALSATLALIVNHLFHVFIDDARHIEVIGRNSRLVREYPDMPTTGWWGPWGSFWWHRYVAVIAQVVAWTIFAACIALFCIFARRLGHRSYRNLFGKKSKPRALLTRQMA